MPSVLYVAKLFTNSNKKFKIEPKKEVMGPTIKPGSFMTMLPPPNKTTVSEIIDDNCVPPKNCGTLPRRMILDLTRNCRTLFKVAVTR